MLLSHESRHAPYDSGKRPVDHSHQLSLLKLADFLACHKGIGLLGRADDHQTLHLPIGGHNYGNVPFCAFIVDVAVKMRLKILFHARIKEKDDFSRFV